MPLVSRNLIWYGSISQPIHDPVNLSFWNVSSTKIQIKKVFSFNYVVLWDDCIVFLLFLILHLIAHMCDLSVMHKLIICICLAKLPSLIIKFHSLEKVTCVYIVYFSFLREASGCFAVVLKGQSVFVTEHSTHGTDADVCYVGMTFLFGHFLADYSHTVRCWTCVCSVLKSLRF